MFEKCQAGIGRRIKSVSMLLAHVITFWIPPTFDLHSFVIAVNFLQKIHKNSCFFFKHGLAHDSTTIRNLKTIRNTEKLVKQNLKQKNWLPLSRQDWEKCLKDAFPLGWRPPSIWRPNTRTKPDLTPHAGRHQPKQPISGLWRLAAADRCHQPWPGEVHSKSKTQHTTCARWVRPQEEERAKPKAGLPCRELEMHKTRLPLRGRNLGRWAVAWSARAQPPGWSGGLRRETSSGATEGGLGGNRWKCCGGGPSGGETHGNQKPSCSARWWVRHLSTWVWRR